MKILGGDWPQGRQAGVKTSFMGKPVALLLFNSVLSYDTIALAEISAAEIVTSENHASLAGKLGWGTAGALVLGPVGLLAGLLAGGNRQSVILAVKFKDGRGVLLEGKSREMQPLLGAGYRA